MWTEALEPDTPLHLHVIATHLSCSVSDTLLLESYLFEQNFFFLGLLRLS